MEQGEPSCGGRHGTENGCRRCDSIKTHLLRSTCPRDTVGARPYLQRGSTLITALEGQMSHMPPLSLSLFGTKVWPVAPPKQGTD